MSDFEGRHRTRGGDVIIARAVETTTPDGDRVVEIHTGEPAAWSTPAFRVQNPPGMVAAAGGQMVENPQVAFAEAVAAASGVMIVRERR